VGWGRGPNNVMSIFGFVLIKYERKLFVELIFLGRRYFVGGSVQMF